MSGDNFMGKLKVDNTKESQKKLALQAREEKEKREQG